MTTRGRVGLYFQSHPTSASTHPFTLLGEADTTEQLVPWLHEAIEFITGIIPDTFNKYTNGAMGSYYSRGPLYGENVVFVFE